MLQFKCENILTHWETIKILILSFFKLIMRKKNASQEMIKKFFGDGKS